MTQRVNCPICTDWEILKHNRARRKTWKCSRCSATIDKCPNVIVRYGNHFMTNRPGEEPHFSTNNSALARLYTFAYAESVRISMMRKECKMVDLYTPLAAANMVAKEAKKRARAEYFYAFENEVCRIAALDNKPIGEKWNYLSSGKGSSRIVFGYESYFHSGIDPYTAAEEWYQSNKPVKFKKVH